MKPSHVALLIVVIIVVFIGIFAWDNADLLSAFMSRDAGSAFSACAISGGKMTWVEEGVFVPNPTRRLECVIPYEDGGKACTDGSQCVSRQCVAKDQSASKGAVVEGACAKDSKPLSCTTTVTSGKSNGEWDFCAF